MKWMNKLYTTLSLVVVLSVQSIYAQDQCQSIGWANYDGQTFVGPPTGGGNASVTQVTTFAQLKSVRPWHASRRAGTYRAKGFCVP